MLIEHIVRHYKNRYSKVILGTGDVPGILAFYGHRGFTETYRVTDYFTEHYDHPIIEEGVLLKDKVYLERKLRVNKQKTAFLAENHYVDFSEQIIRTKAAELFDGITDDTQKARIAFEFVRDKIPHSFDIDATIITAKASDVLRHKTGICHAKANLLAALLRSQDIPTGFCYQHCTIMDDDSAGYCVHCYNAVWLDERWIRLDARGNKPGVNAQFSLEKPVLAFPLRLEYDEYFWPGIYASPHAETMTMLERADSLEYIIKNIPDKVTLPPDADDDYE
jgi:transglutaminase-like putative cysteine protease